MLGSFVPRALLMVFGYAYPAYECYKVVENKPEIEQLLFWCQYWILVAMLTVLERVGDALFSWLPIYNEAKLALFIYLWSSKVQGTTYLYNRFFRGFVAQHEEEIDKKISELRVKTLDIANVCWQKALCYGQTGVFEVLQYASSQSASLPNRDQKKEMKANERVEVSDQCHSEAEAKDQKTSELGERPTEYAPLSDNGTPMVSSRRWLRKLIR